MAYTYEQPQMASAGQDADANCSLSHREMWVIGNKARLLVLRWRALLAVAGWLGRLPWLPAVAIIGGTAAVGYFASGEHWLAALAAPASVALALLVLRSLLAARDRFIIGDFDMSKAVDAGSLNLANLLLVEIDRLSDLFRVVGDRRAVASELTHTGGLDATLSVDDLIENVRSTISSETKATIGPVTIPLAPFVTLIGKLMQSPRLTGNLHRDGQTLIITAQTTRRWRLSWRVEARATAMDASPKAVSMVISAMVEELALRIYTDLALGRAVRWEATRCFVKGLRAFRESLRAPKDRKVNLKRAEKLFIETLAEDEDFPLVYYNLGVVYTELHGLAVTAGRGHESKMRLSAAETAFGRAIEKDPARWECYFAFAQTHFRYKRFDSVVGLCEHIIAHVGRAGDRRLRPGWADQAKVQDLWAQALLHQMPAEESDVDGYRAALGHAQRAAMLALRSLARVRIRLGAARRDADDLALRCNELATACLLTLSDIYSRHLTSGTFGEKSPRRRRETLKVMRGLITLAPTNRGKAELRFAFGDRTRRAGDSGVAEDELAVARRSDPTRPSYAAGLALARATKMARESTPLAGPDRQPIDDLCEQALQGMVGAYFPARDSTSLDLLACVYELLNDDGHDDRRTAQQLRKIERAVKHRLDTAGTDASVSGFILESVAATQGPLSKMLGPYGKAVLDARAGCKAGRARAKKGRAKVRVKLRKALGHAERATSLNPMSALAWETLGDVHRELLDFRNALSAWEQALGLDPDNPRLYDKIGSSYWHIAFQGRTRASREDLEHADKHFERALTLYDPGSREHVRTHYRLGKLHAALRDFKASRGHLDIVEASGTLPIVGWGFLGFAYLERRNFSECEFYFSKVVAEGIRLDAKPADRPVGDRLDEQFWPLGLVRAWGHLGLAISLVERDGDLGHAQRHVDAAAAQLAKLHLDRPDAAHDERFPTRAHAVLAETRGLILLHRGAVAAAKDSLEEAVRQFPHSRAYLGLALALERCAADADDPKAKKALVERAERLLDHAVSLGPTDEPLMVVRQARTRLARLQAPTGGRGNDHLGVGV